MTKNYFVSYLTLFLLFSDTAFARCAVCYTNGMSGASIAVIVIVTSFIVLFFANKFLQKILNKN
tara:strand:+ start:1481 stop:1672 length:192 start_codon:yes stop_codon:yes gene_type:complete